MVLTDTEMFGDVDRCGFDPEKNGHPGIFSFEKTPSGLTADSGKDEFFYEGHAMCWELEEFYRKLKKQFPNVGLEGHVYVWDKYPEAFYVKATPESEKITIKKMRY